MRIAIDLRWISRDTGGIRRYVLNLATNLAIIDRLNAYFLIFDGKAVAEKVMQNHGLKNRDNFYAIIFKPGPFSPLSQLLLPPLLRSRGIDVFHSPDFIMPFFTGKTRVIITVHDLIPYICPRLCARSKKVRFLRAYRFFTALAVKRSFRVITDSENSKRDIISVLGVKEEKIRMIYNGVEGRFSPLRERDRIESIKEKYSLSSRNILYVGRQDPSKNLEVLIRAFHRLKREGDIEGTLVIAGKKDARYPAPYRLADEMGLKDDIIYTGYVEEEELPVLYNACDLFVFPSLYEGFGLPPLEAMACGVPVIVSDRTSLPEVAGDAALMIDPSDVGRLAENMKKLLDDTDLRKTMVKRGIDRAARFSLDNMAKKTLAVYEEAKA